MQKERRRRDLFRAVKTVDKTVELNKVGFVPYMMNEGNQLVRKHNKSVAVTHSLDNEDIEVRRSRRRGLIKLEADECFFRY